VQERAQTSFCPVARQVLHYLAYELCRQIAALILSRLTPFLLVWGVRKGCWGEGVHFGPEAQNLHMTVRKIVLTPPDASAQNKHHAHVSFKDIKIVHNNLITTWIWESACWLSSASSPNHPWHALWRVAPDHEVRTCALAGFAVWLQPKGYLLAEKGCTNCVCLWERWYKFWWEAYAIYGQLKVGARK
jgi:hypothetical protein